MEILPLGAIVPWAVIGVLIIDGGNGVFHIRLVLDDQISFSFCFQNDEEDIDF